MNCLGKYLHQEEEGVKKGDIWGPPGGPKLGVEGVTYDGEWLRKELLTELTKQLLRHVSLVAMKCSFCEINPVPNGVPFLSLCCAG